MRLLDPFSLSAVALANRAVVTLPAALRDGQAGAEPTRRAGLLLTEPLSVGPDDSPDDLTAALATSGQALVWRDVTARVHREGGTIVARLTHPPHPAPDQAAIAPVVERFAGAAALALNAGFDGVEVHAAGGRLLDLFLRSGRNRRGDAYGGSVSGRARLLMEVAEAVTDVWGVGRVGAALSPWSLLQGIDDADPLETFTHAAAALDQLGLAWLHLEGPWRRRRAVLTQARQHFGGAIIASGEDTVETAQEVIAEGLADCVAFDRYPADWPHDARDSAERPACPC